MWVLGLKAYVIAFSETGNLINLLWCLGIHL